MNALVQLLQTVTRQFQRRGIPYALVGGITVALWGRPRATEDIDLLVALPEDEVADLCTYLADHDITFDEGAIRDAARDGGSFALEDTWSVHWVDARTPRDAFDRRVIERARTVEVHGDVLQVASPGDVILAKMALVERLQKEGEAAEPSYDGLPAASAGADGIGALTGNMDAVADRVAMHRMDVRSILLRQGDGLPLDALSSEAREMGLEDLWDALVDAGSVARGDGTPAR